MQECSSMCVRLDGMEPKLTVRSRVGKMLVGAAVLVPALAVAGLIAMSHLYLVRYEKHTLITWVAVDGAVLLLGLMLMGEEGM